MKSEVAQHLPAAVFPDYSGGSIVNLMSSLTQGLGGDQSLYPNLRALEPARLAAFRNILLLVIDGLGYHFLKRHPAASCLNSHLLGSMTSVFPSTTATAITTFLTGEAPQQHGLTGWHMHFRELGAVVAVLPGRPRFGGASLAESGISAADLLGHTPVFDRLAVPSHVISPEFIANSDFNQSHLGQASLHPYADMTGMFHILEKLLHGTKNRKYLYAYWPELDRIGHEQGIGSEMATQHLLALDQALTGFLTAAEGTDTLLIVTGDHGMIDTDERHTVRLQYHPPLADSLVIPLCGEPRVAYCYVRAENRELFSDYVRTKLAFAMDLLPAEALIDAQCFGLGPMHRSLRHRVGDVVLILRDNFIIRDDLFGEHRFPQVGVHGGVSDEEMLVPLVLAGIH